MNKEDLAKFKCRVCRQVFKDRRKPLSDPELRKEIIWFHLHSTIHKALEVFPDAKLEQWNTKKPVVVEKPHQDSQATMDFNSNVLGKKKIELGKNPVMKYEEKILPWEEV